MENTGEDIDVVVMWVDGSDPHHLAKRRYFLTEEAEDKRPDVGGVTRFANVGEIEFCIASIHRFAPFIHKIWIITDDQDPHVDKVMAKHFDKLIPMEIVDHRVIFRGYEEYLPTFNARSLETLMWRIPGLSERFILMNDDFFLTAPVQPEDFFRGEKTVSYTSWYNTFMGKILRRIKPRKHGHQPVGFKDSMLNALEIMGGGYRFIKLTHTPRALRRSFYEEFYGSACDDPGPVLKHQDVVLRNICHRFRHAEQFNSQELFYLNEARAGRLILCPPGKKVLYMKPRFAYRYVEKKLESFQANDEAVFGCINSLDSASYKDQQKVLDWLRQHIYGNEAVRNV